jgi:hypothetical protein
MGGPWGIADSSLPALLFVVVYTLFGNDIQTAGIAAVALGGVIAVIRLTRGESARFALTGSESELGPSPILVGAAGCAPAHVSA